MSSKITGLREKYTNGTTEVLQPSKSPSTVTHKASYQPKCFKTFRFFFYFIAGQWSAIYLEPEVVRKANGALESGTFSY